MKYMVSALFFTVSFMMYALTEVIEVVVHKAIIAYLTVNQAAYSEDMFQLDFQTIKVVFLWFTVAFGLLAIYSFIAEERKINKANR
ncbi:hypothetical protein PAECIP111893_01307 [Paenibacillus plantiphilus]|uniref:Uncharacterized protein n=1 Tax=Paenibacillus plantiphilus TaxID=2905650 RepID=A0ABM9SFB8_9BACL|nr:hypothetical protein [Paenibacillus plantiphilus]CAH1199311.1 hypothetical protein PAECIP111893_01307 [Paenibacillus plantiphilus]